MPWRVQKERLDTVLTGQPVSQKDVLRDHNFGLKLLSSTHYRIASSGKQKQKSPANLASASGRASSLQLTNS
jgi:hypothetical protein